MQLFYKLLTIGLLPLVIAIPKFNEINKYQVDGQLCSLPTYYSYPCPVICVKNINDCPAQVRPSCPTGETYCVDGSCRSSCPTDLTSKCACTGQPSLGQLTYPCSKTFVDLPNFVARNKTELSYDTCSTYLNIPNLPKWNPNFNETNPTMMWGECPAPDWGELNFREPVFIALYVFYGSCAGFLLIWVFYKNIREKVIKAQFNKSYEVKMEQYNAEASSKEKSEKKSNVNEDESESIEPEEDMIIKAYKRDILGTFFFI
ncbi:hypothetical protein BJ944DRAFT_241254, partial [Cunninghamella echinulata]